MQQYGKTKVFGILKIDGQRKRKNHPREKKVEVEKKRKGKAEKKR